MFFAGHRLVSTLVPGVVVAEGWVGTKQRRDPVRDTTTFGFAAIVGNRSQRAARRVRLHPAETLDKHDVGTRSSAPEHSAESARPPHRSIHVGAGKQRGPAARLHRQLRGVTLGRALLHSYSR